MTLKETVRLKDHKAWWLSLDEQVHNSLIVVLEDELTPFFITTWASNVGFTLHQELKDATLQSR